MLPSGDVASSNFESSLDDERGEESHLIERSANDSDVSTPTRYPDRTSSDDSVDSGQDRASMGDTRQPTRSLSFLSCLALIIGLQIGSGIFSAPAAVRSHVGSIELALLAWLLAGVLAATGAASFVQLGTLVPINGGIQEYVRYAYGDFFGFSSAWAWIFVSRPLAMAMVSLIFAEYLFKATFPDDTVPYFGLRAASILAITLITWFNSMGTRVGTGIGNVFLVLKVLGLASIAIIGTAAVLFGSHSSSGGTNEPLHMLRRKPVNYVKLDNTELYNGLSGFWVALGGFVDAVLSAVFAYGGWESISFVVGEMKTPETTLPSVLRTAIVLIVTLFLSANFGLYMIIPAEDLDHTNAPVLVFGRILFGKPGALLYTWVVCLSCLGALNSIVFSTGRATQAAAERQYLPKFFKANAKPAGEEPHDGTRLEVLSFSVRWPLRLQRESNENVPRNAMMLNCLLASIYLLIGTFRGLLVFKGMVEYIIYFFTVLGLLLRRLPWVVGHEPEPDARTHSILNPLIFCALAGLVSVRSMISHILEFALIIAFLALCFIFYKIRHLWNFNAVERP